MLIIQFISIKLLLKDEIIYNIISILKFGFNSKLANGKEKIGVSADSFKY